MCSKCYIRYTRNTQRYGSPDYQDYVNIDSSPETRKIYGIGDIWLNQGQCTRCLDVIRSKNKHDFVRCRCGACTIDGGSWYSKCSGPLQLQTISFSIPSKDD